MKKSREQLAAEAREREAEEAGCRGLLSRQARSIRTGKLWGAGLAIKTDGPFICPTCLSDAVIKKCVDKLDHFAHKARLSPTITSKDMSLHDACTKEICAALNSSFPEGNWAIQRPIEASEKFGTPKLVPDISGRIDGKRVVIEVQRSAMTLPSIVKRTQDYSKIHAAILWIVPLFEPLGNDPFRPRLYERYLHSIYWGRTYYWREGMGATVEPVHYGVARRYIDYRSWTENGVEEEAGGFYRAYKTIKTPVMGEPLDIGRDFVREFRQRFTPDNERKEVPPSWIWRDKAPQWWQVES